MKRILSLSLLAFSIPIFADDTTFDWSGLEKSKISLEAGTPDEKSAVHQNEPDSPWL